MSRGAILGFIGALALAGGGWLWLQRREPVLPARASAAEDVAGRAPEITEVPSEQPKVPSVSSGSAREGIVPRAGENEAFEPDAAQTRIRVVEKGNKAPIVGARVTQLDLDPPLVRETDERGWCALPPTTAKTRWLLVEKTGFFHRKAYYQPLDELTISLAPVTTLFGHVVTADSGAPVSGARISLTHNYCKRCEPDVVTSGVDGSYELPGAPRREEMTIVLEAEGFPRDWRRFEVRSDEPRVEQDFQLERGIEISGRVVDFESGVGLAGASVGDLVADDLGSFRGRVLPEQGGEPVGLTVGAEGHCVLMAPVDLRRVTEPLEFRLPRGAIVEGTVRKTDGEAIPDAWLSVDEDHRRRARTGLPDEPTPLDELPEGWQVVAEGYHSSARADEHGRFRVPNVVPWSQMLVLRVGAEGYASAETPIERVRGPGETIRVDFVLERSRPETHVKGRVLLNGSHLRTGIGRVRWTGPEGAGEISIYHGDFYGAIEPGEVAFRCEIDGLPSGLEGAAFTLDLEAGADLVREVDLRVPTRPITGRVLLEDGNPAIEAEVDASCSLHGKGENYWERLHVSAQVAPDGSYVVQVPDLGGLYRVEAEQHHAETSVDGVLPGASGIDFVLPVSGRLLFRVVDGVTRKPLHENGFALEWKRSNEEEFDSWHVSAAPDADGWYEDWLPNGRLDLRAGLQFQKDLYAPALLEGVLIPSTGDAPRFEFVLQRLSAVILQLAEGCPVVPEDHSIALIRQEFWAEVRFDDDARTWMGVEFPSSERGGLVFLESLEPTRLNGLSPGRYLFKVFPPDIVIEPSEVVVEEEMPEPVVVRWRWSR